MGNLAAFIKPAYTEKKIEIILGDRFLDEDGKPVPVVMKSLTQERLNAISKLSMREKKIGNKVVQDIDYNDNLNRCLIESIVFPDLRDRDLCRAYGTEDPVALPSKMFLIDEYAKLAKAFAKLNGLKDKDGEVRVAGEITKN
jgi:hypothetical protein